MREEIRECEREESAVSLEGDEHGFLTESDSSRCNWLRLVDSANDRVYRISTTDVRYTEEDLSESSAQILRMVIFVRLFLLYLLRFAPEEIQDKSTSIVNVGRD